MQVVDSHTEGEPTRVIINGGPDLGTGPLDERLARFRDEADEYRQFAVNEPRGWDAVVGALLCEPVDETCSAGVIFFNNTGYLGMCGHGTIGLLVTLHRMGKIDPGVHRIETPVGIISVDLKDAHTASVDNVPSYRYRKRVSVHIDSLGEICGDIAWGGNWFFLVDDPPIPVTRDRIDDLTHACRQIRDALRAQGIKGQDDALVDHVEFAVPSSQPGVDSVNFVMCPGGAYDRSPCGTGTSAKLACLAADGKLAEGDVWVQQSVCGGMFQATFRNAARSSEIDNAILPTISGRAFICGETTLICEDEDPLGPFQSPSS